MSDSVLRTSVLALAIIALTVLAGVTVMTGHDGTGAVINMVIAGLLGIAGAAAGAHAANGHATTIFRSVDVPPSQAGPGKDTRVVNGKRAGDPPTP